MSQPPLVDERSREELQAELTELAEAYIDDWNADSGDMASLLLSVGAEFGGEVVQRLNRLPEKHRAAFLETIGTEPQPPQAARLPLSVEPASDLDRNVRIPGGTQATATAADETAIFEIPPESGFEATPASLTEVYAVDPARDRLTSHSSLARGGCQQLFDGHNHQQHALYLGDESLFTLDSRGVIEIEFTGQIPEEFEETVAWEYYGQKDGTEQWNRLPAVETTNESLRSRVDRLAETATDDSTYTTRRQLRGAFVETTVDGTESRWIRCRVIEPTAACFGADIESVSVTTHTPHDREQSPDSAFVDDVPLAVDGPNDIEPLGQLPQPSSTLYLASDEPFTKPGAEVQLSFESPTEPYKPTETTETTAEGLTPEFGALEAPPTISWEYWNGSGWTGLDVEDGTDTLQQAGELTFVVPADLESTTVSGQTAHWIRGRLVGGSYGDPGATLANRGVAERPRYSTITIGYDHGGTAVSQLIAENNGAFEQWSTDDGRPFEPLAEQSQTVYFGFDGPLRDGPLTLFVPLEEADYPTEFDPDVQWEYCTDPDTDSWAQLTVDDGTNSLTERGIVRLQFSEPVEPTARFGTTHHWIRAVIAKDQFDPSAARRGHAGDQPAAERAKSRSTAVSSRRPTDRPSPTIEGVYPNTEWADNARTIENEVLGSSDGSANQQFECAHSPLLTCELWVDESNALSSAEQAELTETDPDRIETVTDVRGEQSAVWVRWQAVDALLDGEGQKRVYRLDRTDGTIQFGDGDCGKIPPQGIDSIRATYRTGGGPAGNVPAGAVDALKTPISLVESVDNPVGGAGGSPIEPPTAVAERAAGELRSRGRAVTPADYEHLAASAARTLARVRCLPNRGPEGNRKPGWISVIVIPDADHEQPTPSTALETRLEETLREAAPIRFTSGSEPTLSVRGPTYIPCDIEATLSVDYGSRSQLRAEINETLSVFLHPQDGNGGDGWAFGEPPTSTAIERRLRDISGVTGVRGLSVWLGVDGERRRLRATPQPPTLPDDGLVCSGSHRLTLEVDDGR